MLSGKIALITGAASGIGRADRQAPRRPPAVYPARGDRIHRQRAFDRRRRADASPVSRRPRPHHPPSCAPTLPTPLGSGGGGRPAVARRAPRSGFAKMPGISTELKSRTHKQMSSLVSALRPKTSADDFGGGREEGRVGQISAAAAQRNSSSGGASPVHRPSTPRSLPSSATTFRLTACPVASLTSPGSTASRGSGSRIRLVSTATSRPRSSSTASPTVSAFSISRRSSVLQASSTGCAGPACRPYEGCA